MKFLSLFLFFILTVVVINGDEPIDAELYGEACSGTSECPTSNKNTFKYNFKTKKCVVVKPNTIPGGCFLTKRQCDKDCKKLDSQRAIANSTVPIGNKITQKA
ncbi:maker572 [Drosophila busckii]|uniref:Maker572 n=1 Tax=Drosophila busckii TaxID=30019 RepID=A0A0M4EDQ0_DROBS|nr:uncharacterized protein LOC108595212 [Drosophila busckii]ALC40010.1 maker572 [Drosophila busckii]